jgi:FtsZ-binding cell division protein ZapB
MNKGLNMTYASSLTDLCAVNSSFDTGVLRVAYTGVNPNKSCISKQSFEKSIQTMFGCPIVCNYDRESDTLGGHDMAVVRDANGSLKLINMTNPVGFIPESAKYWWDFVEEEDGTTHEYLFVEALLWKRQEAYQKIKRDGITAQSMEITVKDGEMIDGVFYIYDFEFTAFALIGVAPCFESAALELFSQQDFKEQLSEMMRDLKESFQMVTPSQEDDNTHPQNYSMEGGEKVLQDKIELAAKYGIDVESLDFSLEDYTVEELTEKFEAIKAASENPGEPASEPTQSQYALTSNLVEEIARVLEAVKVEREWGECTRYWYVDCDFEAHEVYCWDTNDWLLYGFTYAVEGDSITVDFESKKRKKYVIADFDEGEQASPFATVFQQMEQVIHDGAEWEAKYQTASDTITTMETELGELRKFKADTENAAAQSARDEVFAQFEDLVGVEAFETLRENCGDYDAATLEEKCFAIRGRQGVQAKFALEENAPKLKVTKSDISNEPYGGIFTEYGIESDD